MREIIVEQVVSLRLRTVELTSAEVLWPLFSVCGYLLALVGVLGVLLLHRDNLLAAKKPHAYFMMYGILAQLSGLAGTFVGTTAGTAVGAVVVLLALSL